MKKIIIASLVVLVTVLGVGVVQDVLNNQLRGCKVTDSETNSQGVLYTEYNCKNGIYYQR